MALSKRKPEGFASFNKATLWLHEGLSALALCEENKKRRRTAMAKRNLRQLKRMAAHSQENFLNKVLLLEGKIAATKGRFQLAVARFERSAEVGSQAPLWGDVGLCYEHLACAHNSLGETDAATECSQKAIDANEKWGARAKILEIKRKHFHENGRA